MTSDTETDEIGGAGPDENDGDDKKMSIIDHLTELRKRLMYAALAFLIVFFICFYFSNTFFNFLVAPLANVWEGEENRRLIFTAMHEKFFTNIKVAFFVAAFLAFPIFAVQIWMFVAPGLYKNEKGAFLPFLLATPFLFFSGGNPGRGGVAAIRNAEPLGAALHAGPSRSRLHLDVHHAQKLPD